MDSVPPTPPPGAPADPRSPSAQALGFFGVLLALLLPDLLAQASSRVFGLAWSELFTILLPAVVVTAGSNLRAGPYLGLVRPRLAPVLLGALVGAGGFLAANGVMALWVMVLPPRVLQLFPDVGRIFEGPPLTRGVVIAVAAGLAPFCEEVAFRGYLQRTLQRALAPASAIGLTAFLFAARHLDPVRFPALVLLGALFGWLAWRADSLWPAIAAHAANNALAVLAATVQGGDPSPGGLTLAAALTPLTVGGAALVGLAVAYRAVTPRPAPPSNPLPRRDPVDGSTRFRLERVPGTLIAAASAGLAGLLGLVIWSAL